DEWTSGKSGCADLVAWSAADSRWRGYAELTALVGRRAVDFRGLDGSLRPATIDVRVEEHVSRLLNQDFNRPLMEKVRKVYPPVKEPLSEREAAAEAAELRVGRSTTGACEFTQVGPQPGHEGVRPVDDPEGADIADSL